MPRLDKYHEIVKTALIKDGWTITADPLTIEFKDARLFADIGAERTLAAEKGTDKIAVEIKVFSNVSSYSDLEKAVGQYQIYRVFLNRLEPERKVVLAVSETIYRKVFLRESVQVVVSDLEMDLLIFDEIKEEIVKWIS